MLEALVGTGDGVTQGRALRARRAVEDLRFPLMRHWSVYDAITHSRYVAVRLATWRKTGRGDRVWKP